MDKTHKICYTLCINIRAIRLENKKEKHMEKEPFMNYIHGGQERQFRRDNTALYTYMGRLALYNHAFTLFDKTDDGQPQQGLYIYKELLPEQYGRLEEFIVDNQFEQHLNQRSISENDMKHLDSALLRDLATTDTVPDEWQDGTE